MLRLNANDTVSAGSFLRKTFVNNTHHQGEVTLADNQSASQLLGRWIQAAVERFDDALNGVNDADLRRFRDRYPRYLPRFEAERLRADARGEIADFLLQQVADCMRAPDGQTPLATALAEPVAPLVTERRQFHGQASWTPSMTYRGERWRGEAFAELGNKLAERNVITEAAADALTWLAQHAMVDGALSLQGRRIAVMGAGAEMAPTRHWLRAGADVLWLDTQPPPQEWLADDELIGTLTWVPANIDLLTQPREVLATIIQFAEGRPLDLGLYAYAPGKARELRLTAVMNAIVEAMPADLVASVTMLVSPTTPTSLSATDLQMSALRCQSKPGWEACLAAIGVLSKGGYASSGEAATTHTVVGIQGASYQAAQYLGKVLTAERWAQRGTFRVSANTAAITRTRSLAHPVFAAAFGGAEVMGVETMTPIQSRTLNGLLAVHDWSHPERPVPGDIRVHGGLHTLPYPLESALRVAAAIGFARSPRLLRGLIARG